jgi:8-amino-7-oxononanoate synthase
MIMEKELIEKAPLKNILSKCVNDPRVAYLQDHVEPFFRTIEDKQGQIVTVDGKELITFGTCDYLGLSTHERIKQAMSKSLLENDITTSSSRALCGSLESHKKLESMLCNYVGGEKCLSYILGFMANLGTISALTSSSDIILVDAKSHASIIDGCRLSGAKMVPYKHNDMFDLEKKILRYKENKIIVTDGVFSMDGDLAKLDEIYYLGQKYDAALYVDDAHGLGMFGKTGSGTPEHFGLQGKIDVVMGTLSKSVPCLGGYVLAQKEVAKYLECTSRTYIFTLGLPGYITDACIEALTIMQEEPNHLKRLWDNIIFFKNALQAKGFNLGATESAIIPIHINDETKTYKMALMLQDRGVFADAVFYPAVKKNESRIRMTVTAGHTQRQLEKSVEIITGVGRDLGII